MNLSNISLVYLFCAEFLTIDLLKGSQPFGPINLLIRPPVLIPRPETEHWVLKFAETYAPSRQKPVNLLDLATGSGCVPILLCHLWAPGSVNAHAVDISPHALSLANDNASLNGIPTRANHNKNIQNTFTTSMANILNDSFPDAATRMAFPFDIITSNPPYVSWKDYVGLPTSVKNFEDPRALFGGPSGLEFYLAISRLVCREDILKPGGLLALEVGHDQAEKVETLMLETGRFRQTEIWLDPWEKQRTVIAQMW